MRLNGPLRLSVAVLLSFVAVVLWATPGLAAPLLADPTPPAPTLTLGVPHADAALGEMQIAVQNGAVPLPAGAAWKLWRRASPTATGRTLAASGKLPALAAGESYLLIVRELRNPGSYRLQLVWGQGKQAQVTWSQELSYTPVASTPAGATTAPTVTHAATAPTTPTATPSPAMTKPPKATATPTAPLPTATYTPHTALLPMIVGPGATATVLPTASPIALATAPTHAVSVPIIGGPVAQPGQPRWTLALLGALGVLALAAVVGAITYLSQPGGEPNILPPMEEPPPDGSPEEPQA